MKDYVRWREEILQIPKQVAISSGEVREIWRCPPDESLKLEGKELAFFPFLYTLERFLHWHVLDEIGKCHDCILKGCDCAHKAFRTPPTLFILAFGLKIFVV